MSQSCVFWMASQTCYQFNVSYATKQTNLETPSPCQKSLSTSTSAKAEFKPQLSPLVHHQVLFDWATTMASHTVYREVQFAHKNAEVSYIVNDDEESNGTPSTHLPHTAMTHSICCLPSDALVGKTRAQARADAAGASTGTRKLRAFVAMLRHLFISLFLPVGYPHSVAPEYITFQGWFVHTTHQHCSQPSHSIVAVVDSVGHYSGTFTSNWLTMHHTHTADNLFALTRQCVATCEESWPPEPFLKALVLAMVGEQHCPHLLCTNTTHPHQQN